MAWKITRDHQSPCSIEDTAHPGVALAKVYLTDADTHKRTPEAIANARLIAASPDLLAVLEEFVEDVETSYQHSDEFPDGDALEMLRVEWPDLAITYEKAVKAIALAKGGK